MLEVEEGSFQPIPLYLGPLDDGAPIAALGYPGNVDLATARAMDDYVRPLPPTRSIGIFSNVRPINGITTLLHTANIARGHSGGPLLDQCGRVLGVNTLITRNQDGDAPFAFAVSNRELTAFLQQQRQPFQSITTECVSMSDRLRQDQERAAAEERARQAAAAADAQKARDTREDSLAEVQEMRENRLALAILLLVFALLAFGGGGLAAVKNRPKPAMIMAGLGAVLLIAAIIAFLSRPSRADIEAAEKAEAPAAAAPDRFVGRNLCRLVPERSRVTISPDQRRPARLDRDRLRQRPHPICAGRRRSGPGSSSPPTSGRCRCSSSGPATANMSSPATSSRRRRWSGSARCAAASTTAPAPPISRRAPSSPTSSARSPRCCRGCPTSGWSIRCANRERGAGPLSARTRLQAGGRRGKLIRLGGKLMIRKLLFALALLVPAIARAEWHEAVSTNFIVYSQGSQQDAIDFAGEARTLPFRAARRSARSRPARPTARLRVFLLPGSARGRRARWAAAASPAITSRTRAG